MVAPEPVGQLRSRVESVLLVVDQPVTTAALASALAAEESDVAAAVEEMRAEYDARGMGFEVASTPEGHRLVSRRDNARPSRPSCSTARRPGSRAPRWRPSPWSPTASR